MVREKTYLLELEFYNTDRKTKSTNRSIFISIIMHPNFMHFRKKNKLFKSALEILTPVSGHSRTALKTKQYTFTWISFPFPFQVEIKAKYLTKILTEGLLYDYPCSYDTGVVYKWHFSISTRRANRGLCGSGSQDLL